MDKYAPLKSIIKIEQEEFQENSSDNVLRMRSGM